MTDEIAAALAVERNGQANGSGDDADRSNGDGAPAVLEGPRKPPTTAITAEMVDFGVFRQVPMTVRVEIGRAAMTLGEILEELEVGSSIRLDRHVGEPVEVYVNGALFARAEVVVMQERIGARIIELVGPRETTRSSGLR